MPTPPGLLRAVRALDAVARWTRVAVVWLVVLVVAGVVYEVMARYVFSAPTLWPVEVTGPAPRQLP